MLMIVGVILTVQSSQPRMTESTLQAFGDRMLFWVKGQSFSQKTISLINVLIKLII